MGYIDQGSGIEIPVIEIAEGWTVDELETLDDCDDAFAYLTGALVGIESQIDDAEHRGDVGTDHFRRLKAARRWKKAALSVVGTTRGKINRQAAVAAEQRNLAQRKTFASLFMKEVKERDPVLFESCAKAATEKAQP